MDKQITLTYTCLNCGTILDLTRIPVAWELYASADLEVGEYSQGVSIEFYCSGCDRLKNVKLLEIK